MRELLLLSDDNFLCEVLGTYVRRDGIEVIRVASIHDAVREIAAGAAAGVLIDIAKRGLSGNDVIATAQRAERAKIPLLVISSQPRRELSEFAAVVRATDVISKSEAMTAIAARLRLWLNREPVEDEDPAEGFEIPELAVGT